MGQFSVRVTIVHPTDPNRSAEVDLLVNTGATLSWVSKETLDRLGAPSVGRRQFLVADGRTVERQTVGVTLRLNGTQAMVTVIAAEPGDSGLLGATALESLGFGVDPINKRLVPQALLAM